MSGGVDSAVAAAFLKEQGYQVTGVTFNLYEDASRCGNTQAIQDAQKIAQQLLIPHYILDLKKEFQEQIIDYFVKTYLDGKTPNPCVWCNHYIKFAFLFQEAQKLGINWIATGHYAKIVSTPKGFRLTQAKDTKKSQDYFLALLNQAILSKTLFPLAHYTKEEVRQKALNLNLLVSQKKDSQEVCFIPHNDYVQFIEDYTQKPSLQGDLLNTQGQKVGTHKGVYRYTIGQRRGIGVGLLEPHYVVSLCPLKNQVVVGTKEKVYQPTIGVKILQELEPLKENQRVFVRIRYRNQGVFATLHILSPSLVLLKGEEPFFAPALGQLVAFYNLEGFLIAAGELYEN